ncbi:MAG: hypothetical protein WC004_04420, partial [Candidatus Absconditabacterales bacterium]
MILICSLTIAGICQNAIAQSEIAQEKMADQAKEQVMTTGEVQAETGTIGVMHSYEARADHTTGVESAPELISMSTNTLGEGDRKGGTIGGELGRMIITTFDIDFGSLSSLTDMYTLRGNRFGNGGYLTVQDGRIAPNGWYVMLDATDMISSAGRVIDDSSLVLTSYAGPQAVTTLQGTPSLNVMGVGQQVNLDGSLGYVIMERRSMADG